MPPERGMGGGGYFYYPDRYAERGCNAFVLRQSGDVEAAV